jgi:hypothetical protein
MNFKELFKEIFKRNEKKQGQTCLTVNWFATVTLKSQDQNAVGLLQRLLHCDVGNNRNQV